MKTSELTGKDLDHWVAKAKGWTYCASTLTSNKPSWTGIDDYYIWRVEDYTPSTNSGQCFELMQLDSFRWVEKFRGKYNAMFNQLDKLIVLTSGPTLNIAICRAFVASVYGEEVSDGG